MDATPPAVRRTFQLVGMVDLFLTLPFALPAASGMLVALLQRANAALGWRGSDETLGPLGLLFLNLMGVLAVCWNGARATTGSADLARIDVPARLVVAALIVGYVAFGGVPPILLVFVVTEVAGALVQGRALARA